MNNDSFDKILLFLITVIVTCMVIYLYFYHNFDTLTCPSQPHAQLLPQGSITNSHIKSDLTQSIIPNVSNTEQNITVDVNRQEYSPSVGEIMRDYDYRALVDPLTPPYKRDDFTLPYPSFPTRGYPSAFKKIGYLIDESANNDDKYKFMLLMGRQKYPGSNNYDYYVTENNSDSALKFDLHHLHRELLTHDDLEIKELQKHYKVKIDRTLGSYYNPFYYYD